MKFLYSVVSTLLEVFIWCKDSIKGTCKSVCEVEGKRLFREIFPEGNIWVSCNSDIHYI